MKDYQTNKATRAAGMLTLAGLALLLCAYAPQSQAACKLGDGIAKNVININLGNVPVPLNTPVSKEHPFFVKRFPISHKGTVIIQCGTEGGSLVGVIPKLGQVDGTNRVFRTNIPGIGIRIGFRLWETVPPRHFPFSEPTPNSISSTSQNWTITVELFKTASRTGNGPLEEGLYGSMYAADAQQDALRVVVSGRAATISTPSCTVATTPPVQLGKVWKNLFSSVGSTAAEQRFDIKLNCREVKPEPNDVYLQMDAKPDASGAPGVMAVTTEGVNAATGVGIQVLDKDRKPIVYGETSLVGKSKDGVYTLPFYARYYQTANQVTAGVANGAATLTLSYK